MSFENHEWRVFELNALCTVTDCQHKTAPVVNYKTKFKMLRTTNIRNGRINADDARYVTEETYEAWSVRGKLVEEDVILTREAPMGEVGIIKSSYENFFLGQRMLQLKAKTDVILPYFLYYSLLAPEVQNQIKMHEGTGSVVSNIRIPALKKFKLMVPALKTQESVSRILKLIDDKIDLNNAINKNLEEMAQALFKRWFVDFEFPNENGEPYKSSGGEFEESEIGLIPKGWRVGAATEIFNVQSGGTPKTGNSEFWDGEIPFFTPKDSGNSFYAIHTEKKLTESGLSNCNSKLYKAGTVFITARGTVGKLTIAGRDMAMNQSCYALVSASGYTQKYIFLQTQLLINAIKKNASGAVFDAITVSTFQSLKVTLPNIELVIEFDRCVESIFNSILKNINENQLLSEMRDTLLPKLMSGEIQVPIDKDYSQTTINDLPIAAETKAQYSTT